MYYFYLKKIQSLFSRVRLLYGATPIEDIIGYNQIVRSVTEWTNPSSENTITQQSINEGIGGYCPGRSGVLSSTPVGSTSGIPGLVNVRQAYIQGISTVVATAAATFPNQPFGNGFGVVPAGSLAVTPAITGAGNSNLITTTNPVKRYQIQFALGLFNQPKLIPTKFMASQLSIEITLANAAECIFTPYTTVVANPTYSISNVNLIPEILEFDASYGISKITKMKCF